MSVIVRRTSPANPTRCRRQVPKSTPFLRLEFPCARNEHSPGFRIGPVGSIVLRTRLPANRRGLSNWSSSGSQPKPHETRSLGFLWNRHHRRLSRRAPNATTTIMVSTCGNAANGSTIPVRGLPAHDVKVRSGIDAARARPTTIGSSELKKLLQKRFSHEPLV